MCVRVKYFAAMCIQCMIYSKLKIVLLAVMRNPVHTLHYASIDICPPTHTPTHPHTHSLPDGHTL